MNLNLKPEFPKKGNLNLVLLRKLTQDAEQMKLTISMGVDFTEMPDRLRECFSEKQKSTDINVLETTKEGSYLCELKCGLTKTFKVIVPAECIKFLLNTKPEQHKTLQYVHTVQHMGCQVHSFG